MYLLISCIDGTVVAGCSNWGRTEYNVLEVGCTASHCVGRYSWRFKLSYPEPIFPSQEETANNIRGQLRSRDGILTDLKGLRWESFSDGWNTSGPIGLTRGSRNQWRSDGGRGGSHRTWQLFLVERFQKKIYTNICANNMFLERVQRKSLEQSN